MKFIYVKIIVTTLKLPWWTNMIGLCSSSVCSYERQDLPLKAFTLILHCQVQWNFTERFLVCVFVFFYKKAPLKLPSQIWCNFTISVLVWRQHKLTRLCDWPVTTTTSTTTRLFMLSLDIYNIQQKPIRPA